MSAIVYTDLDGTMVGPRGCFFRSIDGGYTLEPAQALVDLHRAGGQLVLVSGRTRPQLIEASRIFGADGYIAELGAVVGWDGGRQQEVLRGAMPYAYGTRTPMQVMAELGVVEDLFGRWPGLIEWHSPWHAGHEADAMLRGRVEVTAVDRWLTDRDLGWLGLRDNGVLPPRRATTLAPEALPAHVYHLMPNGLSKGLAVARDLERRGLSRGDAIAIGDSVSDLEMAPHVGQMWIVPNGARHEHMAPLIAAHDNVRVAAADVGIGWAQAVRSALR